MGMCDMYVREYDRRGCSTLPMRLRLAATTSCHKLETALLLLTVECTTHMAVLMVSPLKNHHFRGKILHFQRGNHLRTLLSLILSGPTDPRFQGETSSVPHEEREHGYQKGRSEGSREARRRG